MSEDLAIRIVGEERSFGGIRERSVLASLAPVHHRKIASGCHGGGCGVCKIQVLAGFFRRGPMSRVFVSEEDSRRGIALACQVFPLSDLLVVIQGALPSALVRKYGFLSTGSGASGSATG